MKTFAAFCSTILLLCSTLWSQEAAPTPPPSLPGPAIEKRAPDYSQWLITTMVSGTTARNTDSSTKIMVTKTGRTYRVERLDQYQQIWTVWAQGATQIMVWPDKRTAAELAVSNNPDAPNPFMTDFSVSDFPGFEWVTWKQYTDIKLYKGCKCIVYQDLQRLKSDDPAAGKIEVSLTAYVDLDEPAPGGADKWRSSTHLRLEDGPANESYAASQRSKLAGPAAESGGADGPKSRPALLIGTMIFLMNRTLYWTLPVFVAVLLPGALEAAERPAHPVIQASDGTILLGASDAVIDGPNAKREGGEPGDIAWWTNVDTSLRWIAKVDKPGKYRVEMNFAVLGNANHDELSIAAEGHATKAVLTPGRGIDDFKWGQAGVLTVSKAGEIAVTVTPLLKEHACVMYLRSILLRPADAPIQAIDISGCPIKPATNGVFKLDAADAEIDGMDAVLEGSAQRDIGFWRNRDTSVRWQIAVDRPGKYRVEMNYSLTPSSEGSKVAVLVGDQTVTAKPLVGANWKDYQEARVGEVTITGTGYLPVVVKPVSKPGDYVLNLRSVTLAPADLPSTAMDISDKAIRQASDGSIKLTALDAEIDGEVARLQGGDEKYIVWWGSREEGDLMWHVSVNRPGRYDVMVAYSLAQTGNSSDVALGAGGQSIAAKLAPTQGWDTFKTVKLGTLDIQDKGDLQIVLNSPMEPGLHILNLHGVELVPAGN